MALGATPNRQAAKVGNSDESFIIADQPAHDCSTYPPDHLDVEMGRGMHCSSRKRRATTAPGPVARDELNGRRGVQHNHSDRASRTSSAPLTPRSRRRNASRRSRTSSRAGSSAISPSRTSRKSLRLIRCAAARAFSSCTSSSGTKEPVVGAKPKSRSSPVPAQNANGLGPYLLLLDGLYGFLAA